MPNQHRQHLRTSLLIVLGVAMCLVFAAIAISGLSLLTGNHNDSGIKSSKASAQEPADINNDNTVNGIDLSILLSNWNTANTTADVSKDGVVNAVDLSMLLSKWGAVSGQPQSTELSAQDLQLINTKRIVFGHQSVGGNIMDGIENTYSSLGVALPNETTTRTAPASGAYFMDFYVGSNGDPTGKTSDFNTVMRNGTGSRADVAFFKFCYVDVGAGTNITTLFNYYKSTMDALATSYPNVKFIYVTQPLTTNDAADNLQREQYNILLRNAYGATGRVFDLAKVESTQPNGQRVSGTLNSQTYYSLYSGYTSDGGHLNTAGSNAAAKELLMVIANQLK